MIPGEGVGVQSMWRPKEGRVTSNVHLPGKAQTFVCSHVGRGPRQEAASGLEPLQRTSTKAMPSRNVGPELLQSPYSGNARWECRDKSPTFDEN